jgi:hypothetical protein
VNFFVLPPSSFEMLLMYVVDYQVYGGQAALVVPPSSFDAF